MLLNLDAEWRRDDHKLKPARDSDERTWRKRPVSVISMIPYPNQNRVQTPPQSYSQLSMFFLKCPLHAFYTGHCNAVLHRRSRIEGCSSRFSSLWKTYSFQLLGIFMFGMAFTGLVSPAQTSCRSTLSSLRT